MESYGDSEILNINPPLVVMIGGEVEIFGVVLR
jgi:hypothetical protein